MAKTKTQNFENHTRIVPIYHGLAFGILVINLLYWLYRTAAPFSFEHLVMLLQAVALLIMFFYARVFALTVQDRVIRLEMRLRLGQVLPADLQSRMKDLTVDQFVALRFAGDEELPDLVRKVLTDNLTDRKTIKRMVKNWQADFLRA